MARDGFALTLLAVIAFLPAAFFGLAARQPVGATARIVLAQESLGARALAERTIPLWNPYEFGGRPHLADPGTRALYPPHLVLRLLPFPWILPISFGLHTWLAGLGAFWTARRLGATRIAAFASSVAMMLTAVLAAGAEMPYTSVVYRLAWLPLILALVLRSVERKRLLPDPALVCVTLLAMTASLRGPLDALIAVILCGLFVVMWLPAGGVTRLGVAAQLGLLVFVAAGLGAFLLIPAARLQAASAAGRFVSDSRRTQSRLLEPPDRKPIAPSVMTALGALDVDGRLLSSCDEVVDSTHLIPLGIPDAGGTGGVLSADYARVTNLARGPGEPGRAVYLGIREAGTEVSRADLLRFMSVEYLIACTRPDPDRWTAVSEAGGVGVYRNRTVAPRAFWTCSAEAVGRAELEHRLRRGTYDDRFTLHPNPVVHVRWPADLAADDRRAIEAALHIVPQRDLGERTWQYDVTDRSAENVEAIVTHPRVEDTHGIDRASRVLLPPPVPRFDEAKTEWLVGGTPCDEPARVASVLKSDRLDGAMVVAVEAPREGLVFLSETYDAGRIAWLDGRRIQPLKVNFAFTAIPVNAGVHRIVLGYDRKPFLVGVAVSLVTLGVWILGEWRIRR